MPKSHKISLTPATRAVLEKADVAAASGGFLLRLPSAHDLPAAFQGDSHGFVDPAGRLPRDLYTAVDKLLRAMGGKWDRRAGGHRFDRDPRPELFSGLDAGHVPDTKKDLQQFFTPREVARELVDLAAAHVRRDVRWILEPSAGAGALVAEALQRWPRAHLTAVEIDDKLAATHLLSLLRIPGRVATHDFLLVTPPGYEDPTSAASDRYYDVVLTNPPFTGGQDVRHVLHGWRFVAPGGVLAAIVSCGVLDRPRAGKAGQPYRDFQNLHNTHCVAHVIVPAGAFRASGTMVETKIVVWRKPEGSPE